MQYTSRTFKLMGAAKTKEECYLYNAAIEDTNNRLNESKPKPHQGHTFTIIPIRTFSKWAHVPEDVILLSQTISGRSVK